MARPIRTGVPLLLLCLATACGSTVQVRGTAQAGGGLGGAGAASQGIAPSGTQPGTAVERPAGTPSGTAPTGSGGSGPAPVATTAASGTGVPVSSGTAGFPAKGRGWDEKNVYVGVPTTDDFESVARGAGAQGSNGSIHGDVDAIVADLNRSGGILGRKVVAVYHDAKTTDLAFKAAATAQEMCTYFTQDRPVVAVVNGAPQLDAQEGFHRCLEAKQTSLISFANSDYGDADYRRLGPHLWTAASLSTDLLVPSFVAALKRQGFFTGWDTVNGKAGVAPVRVGLLLPDTAQGRHVQSLMTAALRGAGVTLASTFLYDPVGLGSASRSEVLQFTSAKVTHVLDLPPIAAEIWFFQGTAEQQSYRPRYGFTSFNLPQSVEQNASLAPPRQQVGSMGIGWQPFNDSNAAHDPGPTPGLNRCLTALRKGGQTFGAGQRRGALIGVQFCDAFYLLRDATVAARGLDGAALLRGMPLAGPRFSAAGTFASTLATDNHGVPGFYRDQQYRADCSCFVYLGGNHRFTR